MNVKELMIGNYIAGIYEDDEGDECEVVCRVLALDETGEMLHYKIWVETFGGKNSKEYFQEFKPIPITEIWLKKLGFIKDTETNYRWLYHLGIIAYDIDDNCIRISDSWEFGRRRYVHEMQNLIFTLTEK